MAAVASDAASPAGLAPGDVIYGVNGVAVQALSDLRLAVGQIPPASPAVFQVGREGQLRFVTLKME